MAIFLYQGKDPGNIRDVSSFASNVEATFKESFQATSVKMYAAQGAVDFVFIVDLGQGDGSLASTISAVIREKYGLELFSTPLFPLGEFLDEVHTQIQIHPQIGPQK